MKNKKYSKWVAADTILNTTITTIDDKLFFDSLLNLICASSCRLIWKLRLLCFFTFCEYRTDSDTVLLYTSTIQVPI